MITKTTWMTRGNGAGSGMSVARPEESRDDEHDDYVEQEHDHGSTSPLSRCARAGRRCAEMLTCWSGR